MVADLLLGLGDKAETPLVAEHPTGSADQDGAHVPGGAQEAWLFIEFGESLLAPGEVVKLLFGRPLHLVLDGWVARDGGVSLVKALSRDFARMIDTHQPGSVRSLAFVEVCLSNIRGRVRACRAAGWRRDGA